MGKIVAVARQHAVNQHLRSEQSLRDARRGLVDQVQKRVIIKLLCALASSLDHDQGNAGQIGRDGVDGCEDPWDSRIRGHAGLNRIPRHHRVLRREICAGYVLIR